MRYGGRVIDLAKRFAIPLFLALIFNFIVDLVRFLIVHRLFPNEFDNSGLLQNFLQHVKSQLTTLPYSLILMIFVGLSLREFILISSAKIGFASSFSWVVFCVLYLQSLTLASAFGYSAVGDFSYWIFVALIPVAVLLGLVIFEKHGPKEQRSNHPTTK